MPVSTRSQASSGSRQCQTDNHQIQNANYKTRARFVQEEPQLRNPHHGLKEKMKALTLLYEQHKRASLVQKSQNLRFADFGEIGNVENVKEKPKFKSFMLPTDVPDNYDSKENHLIDDMRANVLEEVGNVARKLSMEPRGFINLQQNAILNEFGGGSVGSGSRILVFVRLRPMGKKEKEAGARCCVRIVNRRDVYLTEFAAENDYLRLKRVKGRHFAFDASFPDSATQNDVYSTT